MSFDLNSFNITTHNSLTKMQYQEVVRIVDTRFDSLRTDIDYKIDELLVFNKVKWESLEGLKDALKLEIKKEMKTYKFEHSRSMAIWVGIACYISTILGIETKHIIVFLIGLL